MVSEAQSVGYPFEIIVGEILQFLDSWGLVRDVFRFLPFKKMFGLCKYSFPKEKQHLPRKIL